MFHGAFLQDVVVEKCPARKDKKTKKTIDLSRICQFEKTKKTCMFVTICGIMTITVMSGSLSGCILRETNCETFCEERTE